jgi:HPt (histidine-containing phosphotransfer) domain-containing protein
MGEGGWNVKETGSVEHHEGVDMACLKELRELSLSAGHPERFRNLIDLFLDTLHNDLQSMRAALANHNAALVRELAHGLKGTTGSLGASSLAMLCSRLENACANEELANARILAREIEGQASAVRQIMLKEIQR